MAEFDFRPTYDRNGGISAGDRAAANMSPLAAIAGATPAIFEALKRSHDLIKRTAAIEAISSGLASDKDMTPQQIEQGLKSGLFDAKGLMDVMSTQDLRKQQAEKAKQDAEFKKYLMKSGAQPVRDPVTGAITWVTQQNPDQGPTRGLATPPPPRAPTDMEVLRDIVKEHNANKTRLAGASSEASPLPSAPIGGADPFAGYARPPAGGQFVIASRQGKVYWVNKGNGKEIPAPRAK